MKNVLIRFYSVSAAAVTVMCGASATSAAVLSQIPAQNYGSDTSSWMLMPMVSYQASDGRLHVMMPVPVPQLTPLLVSNPGDSFDPADPWFDSLDPSRQGASFSRRYGFVMDAMSDPLPAGTQMWIRKLSGPPELKMYRYSSSEPKVFAAIFGTDGVTNALYWNGMMFHPTITAPPGTNSFAATFEIYLLDSATGQEVANSSSGPLEFHWTNVSDGRPVLSLAPRYVVTWPAATSANWVLESAETVDATTWTTVTNTPVMVNGEPSVILDGNAAQQYYRMRFVP